MPDPSVLLIEDDEASQYVYGTVLRRNGFTVRSARFGKAGLKSAIDDPPTIVVLDLGLPELDGMEVLRALKQHAATSHVPVLVITVHAFEHDRERATAAGCDEFLPKPLLPSELLSAVQRAMVRCAAPPDPST